MKGLVLKNQNGYFSVIGEDGGHVYCRSRGTLKRRSDLLVGDTVEYDRIGGDKAVISKVYPRSSTLHRPPVANVDQIVLVSAIRTPDLNLHLLDEMILLAENAEISPVICINKCDLAPEDAEHIKEIYVKAGYPCAVTSTVTGKGIDELSGLLTGHIIAFSGPSGAGKSSLLNQFLGEDRFVSSHVSAHTGRGRTTTRHAELVPFKDNSYLMDTPGYTLLDIHSLDADDLGFLFKEFRPYIGKCYFNNCRHISEPDCAVKKAVDDGEILKERYESYVTILRELTQGRG